MDLKEAIYTRHAVRDYAAEPLTESVIRSLIDAAVQAPSAMNTQHWSFYVVENKSLLDRISREAKAQMLRTTPAGLLSHHFEEILSDQSFNIFYNAPALIVICAPEGAWATEDCALAAQNLMLAARAAGLGSCWIGFAQHWLRTPEGKAALKIPAHIMPVAPIILGRPKAEPKPVARKAPEIHWIS